MKPTIIKFEHIKFFLALCVLSFVVCIEAEHDGTVLSMESAVAHATANEPRLQALRLQTQAQQDLTIAARELPDPTFRAGVLNLPVDDLSLQAEPMTQAVIAVRQNIPSGGSREANADRHVKLGEALRHQVSLRSKDIALDVRTAWLNSHFHEYELQLILDAERLFANLAEVVRARYAIGEELQQAVLAADLELSQIRSRLIDIKQRLFESDAELQRLLGDASEFSVSETLPDWQEVPDRHNLRENLTSHPQVLVAEAKIGVESANVRLSESEFKPNWHAELSYGLRDGVAFDGDPRSDFLSATLSLSYPLFNAKKQTRRQAAARSHEAAARQIRQEILRDMNAAIEIAYAEWHSHSEQLELLNKSIIVQSDAHAKAALQAYQNKEGDLTDVLLSYVNQINTKLKRQRVIADRLKTWATIDYLNGAVE